MSRSPVRWGGDAKVELVAGAVSRQQAQFVDVKLPCPRVVRVRLDARQLLGTGNCTGCEVRVTVNVGCGSTILPRVFLLLPTNTAPMDTFLDTPAETVQVEAEVVTLASVPPYTIRVTALVAPWFGDPSEE